jgi:hypothetical protein
VTSILLNLHFADALRGPSPLETKKNPKSGSQNSMMVTNIVTTHPWRSFMDAVFCFYFWFRIAITRAITSVRSVPWSYPQTQAGQAGQTYCSYLLMGFNDRATSVNAVIAAF